MFDWQWYFPPSVRPVSIEGRSGSKPAGEGAFAILALATWWPCISLKAQTALGRLLRKFSDKRHLKKVVMALKRALSTSVVAEANGGAALYLGW